MAFYGCTHTGQFTSSFVAAVMLGVALMCVLVPVYVYVGAVHGFAAVLGGRFEEAPHGALCAALLPYVYEANAQCLQHLSTGVTATAEGTPGQSGVSEGVRADALVSHCCVGTVCVKIALCHVLLCNRKNP
jgi:alcohol dehydrogenase class IV